jgi:hypothetical protein
MIPEMIQALTAGCLATVLIAIGAFTPGWTIISGPVWDHSFGPMWHNHSVTSVKLGLWFQQICTVDSCTTSVYPRHMYDVVGK